MRGTTAGALALALTLVEACNGQISNPGGGGDDDVVDPGELAAQSRFPRLTHRQWENTVRDLFYLDEAPGLADAFDPDPDLGRFDNNSARLKMTSGLWQDYQRAAETMAEYVTADPDLLGGILPADLPGDATQAAQAFIAAFGRRAFRRPLTESEIARYVALFGQASTHYPADSGLDDFTAGVRITIEAMLQSPHFAYRAEISDRESQGAIALSGYEVASRLSYLFWNSMPDNELLDEAASGALDTPQGVRLAAERLFDSPRTREALRGFHSQMLELREYADLDKDPTEFPEWRREVGVMMQTESELFLDSVVFGGGTVGDLLTSARTFVNAELAAIYGLQGDFSDQFVEVTLDQSRRAGFLTRLGFLTRNATLTEPDPIHRGVFINIHLLCRNITAPPNIPDDLMPVGNTNRERINSITGPGTCGEACHGTTINPIGFAFEAYDAVGGFRTDDNGYPIDAAATYQFPDGRAISFDGAVDLSQQLASSPEFHACYVRNLLEYSYGRDLAAADDSLLGQLATASLADGLSVREVVLDLVTSQEFRFRAIDQGGGQ